MTGYDEADHPRGRDGRWMRAQVEEALGGMGVLDDLAVMADLDRASNGAGPLSPQVRSRLFAALDETVVVQQLCSEMGAGGVECGRPAKARLTDNQVVCVVHAHSATRRGEPVLALRELRVLSEGAWSNARGIILDEAASRTNTLWQATLAYTDYRGATGDARPPTPGQVRDAIRWATNPEVRAIWRSDDRAALETEFERVDGAIRSARGSLRERLRAQRHALSVRLDVLGCRPDS